MNPDWEKQWRRKTSKIGISEYVIHVNPGLDQSQPGPTAGAKVLRGSILNKCRIYEVVHIAIVLVWENFKYFFPVQIFWNYVDGVGNPALTFSPVLLLLK